MAERTLFPVTVVGSWPRPPWLIQALRRRQAGEIAGEEFRAVADEAVLAAVKYQEDADEKTLREIWQAAVDGSPVTQTVCRQTPVIPEFEAL